MVKRNQVFVFSLLGLFCFYDFLTLDFLALENDIEDVGAPRVTKQLDLNPTDTRGVTPLLEAIDSGSMKNIRLLVSVEGVDLNAKDKEGHAAIHYAALRNRLDVLNLLLESKKVNVNARDREGVSFCFV